MEPNHSHVDVVKFYFDNAGLEAVQDSDDPLSAHFRSIVDCECEFEISAVTEQGIVKKTVKTAGTFTARIVGGELEIEMNTPFPEGRGADDLTQGYDDVTSLLANPNFEEDHTYGDRGQNVTASGVTYADCYINKVAASNSKFPNVLPVKGWTAANRMSGSSNYARMYSMPYSMDLFCVSPSNVGNYAAQTAGLLSDDDKGKRTLTTLNSWAAGQNAITQTVTLPEGEYRLLLNMKYECTNQQKNDGRRITATGNTNTSLTGVKIGTKTDYRYPSEPNSWEVLCYDFTLTEPQDVILSMGYQSSASVGAANNTLLYIDNVRLLQKINTAIRKTTADNNKATGACYDLAGRRIANGSQAVFPAVYVQNGKKLLQKRK